MPLDIDERQATRVYRREQEAPRPRSVRDERIGFTQPLAPRKGVLDGVSISQVVAGAAAAATSMLLASKIGITGSVIGAAVSSAVTIICSQLYRRALETSAEKLKLRQLGADADIGAEPADDGASGQTERLGGAPYGMGGRSGAARGARIAPTELRMRAAEERRETQRKVLRASVGLAIGAVVLTAGMILLATAGRGIGPSLDAVLSGAVSEQQPADATAGDGALADGGEQANATSAAESGQGVSGDASGADGSDSSGDSTASESSGSGTSGSGETSANGTGGSSASSDASDGDDTATAGGDSAGGSDATGGTGADSAASGTGRGTASADGASSR